MTANFDPASLSTELERAEAYRRRKSTSVLAIVFTDTADSTAIRESLGDVRYEAMREAFDEAVAAIIEEADDGFVVKSTGDGCLAIFAEPSTAVERCLRIQQELGAHQHIRLRIGIDMGQVSVKSSRGIVRDVFGRHVNRAARIEALAEPGQILVSFQVFDCAVGWLKDLGIKWRNCGSHSLKGFNEPVAVYQPIEAGSYPTADDGDNDIRRSFRFKLARSATLPQSGSGDESFDDVPMFSRGTLKRLTESEGKGTLTGRHQLHPGEGDLVEWQGDDPLASLKDRLSGPLSSLKRLLPESPSILWVDDHPGNIEQERKVLEDAGCVVDIATDTDSAIRAMMAKQYLLVVSDMGRGDDTTAGLTLLRTRRTLGLTLPVFVYASLNAVANHLDEAIEEGATLCTSGLVSLLDGIHKTLLDIHAGLEVMNDQSGTISSDEQKNRGSWLSRLWSRLFR